MRQDGPTVPRQDWNDQGPDAVPPRELPGAVPVWTPASARSPLLTQSGQAPRGYVSATWFGMSVGINVALLIGLIGMILLANAGAFGARRPSPGSSPTIQALVSPTATLTPTLSPTPGAGWLQVSPASVQLDCGDNQTQDVVLQNSGPGKVSWQIQFSGSSDQAGVSVSPQQGRLNAGDSVTIHLQNIAQSNDQQGVLQFVPTNGNAGSPANLTYTAQGC